MNENYGIINYLKPKSSVMKKLNFLRFATRMALLLTVIVSLGLSANAQVTVPDGFQYQAIARDGSGVPMADASIAVRFTVTGDNAYSNIETFNVMTNEYGLFNLVVGAGVDFEGLENPVIQVEIDLGGGFVDMGTVPFQSVPYAAVAGNVAYVDNGVLHVGDDTFNVGSFFTGTPGIVNPLEAVVVDANKSIAGFGDIELDGSLNVGSNINAQDYVRILSTANNTYGNWQSGALQVKGGAGIANDVWIGGDVVTGGSVSALSLAVTNGISAGGDITGGGDLHITDIYAAGNVQVIGAITASAVNAGDFYGNFHGGTLDLGAAKSITVDDIIGVVQDNPTALVTAQGVYNADVILQDNIDANTQLIGSNLVLIDANGAAIAANGLLIAANASDIASNFALIDANTTAIGVNAANIAANASDIAVNADAIASNATDIDANALAIADNTVLIGSNLVLIHNNASDIVSNYGLIGENAADIVSNYDLIMANSGLIANNASDIASNFGLITSNANDITSTWTFIQDDLDLQHVYENGHEINIIDNNPVQIYSDNLYGGLDVVASGDAEIAIDAKLSGSTATEHTTIQANLDDAYVAQLGASDGVNHVAVYGLITANNVYGALGATVNVGGVDKHYAGYFNGNAFVKSELTISESGYIYVNNTIGSGDANSGAMVVKGGVGIGENLNVAADINAGKDLSVARNTVLGDDIDSDLLTVNAISTLNGPTTINNTLDVTGAVWMGSTLEVDGATTLNNTLDVYGATNMYSTLTVSDVATFNSDVYANENLYVAGNTEMTGTLLVEDNATLNGDQTTIGETASDILVVNSSSTFNGPVDINNTLTVDALHVLGISDLDGDVNMGADAYVSGDMEITGTTTTFGPLNVEGEFQLNGVEGDSDALMIGQGAGNTPAWTTVAALMEDLTNGAGIEDFVYDGSAPAVVTAAIDDATLIFDSNSDIIVNEGHEFTWMAEHNFMDKIDAQGTIYNDAADLVLDDATHVTGTLDVDGLGTFNNDIEMFGTAANAELRMYNASDALTVYAGADGHSGEGYIKTYDADGNLLTLAGMYGANGSFSVTGPDGAVDGAGIPVIGAFTTYEALLGGWIHAVGDNTTGAGARIAYAPSGVKSDEVRIAVSAAYDNDVFTVDAEGDVMANDLTINDMTASDITADNIYAGLVDATTVDADHLIVNTDIAFNGTTLTGIITDSEVPMVDGDDANLPTAGAVYQHVEDRLAVLYFQELYDNAVASTNLDNLHINATDGPLQIYAPTANGGLDVYASDVAEDAIDARLTTTAETAAVVQAILDGTIYGYLGGKMSTGETAAVYGNDGTNWGAIAYNTGAKAAYAGYFNGNVYMTEDLYVDNNVEVGESGTVHVNNEANATNDQTGALVVDGGVGIGQDLYVGGQVDVGTQLIVGTDATIGDNLIVGDDTYLGEDPTFDVLIVNAVTTINGETTVDDNFIVTGTSDLQGDVTAGADLYVEGNTALNGTLTVSGTSTFNGDAIFNANADIQGTFSLEGLEGQEKELMIGTGSGTAPEWTTVAELMEDLTDGAGIEDFTYDGSAPAVVKVTLDDAGTLEFGSADSDVQVNEAHAFTWTALHTFENDIDAQTSIYNSVASADLELADDVNITGGLTVSDATMLNNTLEVAGTSTFNDDITLTGGDNLLKIDNVNGNRIVELGDGNSNEGFLQTWADDGTELVTIGMNNDLGSVSANDGTNGVWMANDATYGWTVGAGNQTTEGVYMTYGSATADENRLGVMASGVPVFGLDSDGDVFAENVDVNATLNVDGTSTFNDEMWLQGDHNFEVRDASGLNPILKLGNGASDEGFMETYNATGEMLVLIGAATSDGGSVIVREADNNRVLMTNDGSRWLSGVTNDATSFAGATTASSTDAHLLIVEDGTTVFDADQDGNVVAAGTITSGNSVTIDGTNASYGVISETNSDIRFAWADLSEIGMLDAGTVDADDVVINSTLTMDAVTASEIVTSIEEISEPGSDAKLVTEAAVVEYVNDYTLQDAYNATASDATTEGIIIADEQISIVNNGTATWGVTNYVHAMNFQANANLEGQRASGILAVGTTDQVDTGDGEPASLGVSGIAYGTFTNAAESVVGVGGTAVINGEGQAIGVAGRSVSANTGQNAGVFGFAANGGQNIGVMGAFAEPTTLATSSDVAVYGIGTAGHYAGYFDGDVNVTGDLYLEAIVLDNVTLSEVRTVDEGIRTGATGETDNALVTEAAIADWLPTTRGVAQTSKALVLGSDNKILPPTGSGFDMDLGTGRLDVNNVYVDTQLTTAGLTSAASTLNGITTVAGPFSASNTADFTGKTTLGALVYSPNGTVATTTPYTLADTENMVVFNPGTSLLTANLPVSAAVTNGQVITILNIGTGSDVQVSNAVGSGNNVAAQSASRFIYYGSWYKLN